MKRVLSLITLLLSLSVYSQSLPNNPQELIANFAESDVFSQRDLLSPSMERGALESFPEEIREYTMFDLQLNEVNELRSQSVHGFALELSTADEDLRLNLVQVDIFKPGFTVTDGATGLPVEIAEEDRAIHYRGTVEGMEGSIVGLSVSNEEVNAVISIPGRSGNMVLGKLENNSKHILYEDRQIQDRFDFVCQAEDTPPTESTKLVESSRSTVNCAGIYIDLGKDVHDGKGGITPATNYITALFNQVATLYANDNIDIALSGVTVWSSQEPFSTLFNYRDYRNANSVFGDLNAYVNYAYSGGQAWVGGLCGNKYSIQGIFSSFSTVPNYSWSVNVFAHELGHNLGSQHTHACAWNGNNTAIDGCGPNANPDYSEGCSGSNPSGGGTVMSYCHLTSVGVNFSLGFGPQPTARMSDYLDASPCAVSCIPPSCDDGVLNGLETGIDCGGPDCPECPPCPDNELILSLTFDQYTTETSFQIQNATGAIIEERGPFTGQTQGSTLDIELCIPDGCYDFVILDSYGDGMCCNYGNGSYTLSQNGVSLASGGQFGFSEITPFCLTGQPPSECEVYESAPVDLTKSFNPVNGVVDRVQVKWFKESPEVRYSDEDAAMCDIKAWAVRNLDPVTGQAIGNPIQNPDTIVLIDRKKTYGDGSPRQIFKWPLFFKSSTTNNTRRVDPNTRYRFKVRCECGHDGTGLESPWSSEKFFNTPDFNEVTGIFDGSVAPQDDNSDYKSLSELFKVNVYPNPTEGTLNLNFKTRKGENSDIQIFDMLGNLVFSERVSGSGQLMNHIMDLGHLEQGNYVLSVSNDSELNTTRITISR